MVIKIVDEEPVSLAEVKEILDKTEKAAEATYEQKQTMEYVKKFAKIKSKNAVEAIQKIKALGVDKKQAVKILDILPKDQEDLKLIFSKVHYSISDETSEKILEIVRGLE